MSEPINRRTKERKKEGCKVIIRRRVKKEQNKKINGMKVLTK